MKKIMKNPVGRVIGGLVLAAAVGSVFLIDIKPREDKEEPPIRPVKSMIVGEVQEMPLLYFPGVIQPDAEVDLSFEVGGRIIEFPARRGLTVSEGDLLARLDPSNYENQVRNAEADLGRAQSSLDRIAKALETGAVSEEEYSQAKAARDKAEAALSIQRKALEDTRLTARFEGVVSDTYADNFDTVSPGRPILRLQDVSTLAITIAVPEGYMRTASEELIEASDVHVVFDWLPDDVFPLTLKEFATTADPVTRTYRATFTMSKPEEVWLIPDGIGTVVIRRPLPEDVADMILVPSDAVGFTAAGEPFVWALEETENGVYTARRQIIEPGKRIRDQIVATAGLPSGTRIATAGITMLTEGRKVRLLDDAGTPDDSGETI